MNTQILTVSERGQVTIPKTFRKKFGTDLYQIQLKDHGIFLRPLEIEEYEDGIIVTPKLHEQLDEAWNDYQENGGIEFEEVMKISQKKP